VPIFLTVVYKLLPPLMRKLKINSRAQRSFT
jgi:hypothetical protein